MPFLNMDVRQNKTNHRNDIPIIWQILKQVLITVEESQLLISSKRNMLETQPILKSDPVTK